MQADHGGSSLGLGVDHIRSALRDDVAEVDLPFD
jgi:hypothetical protein